MTAGSGSQTIYGYSGNDVIRAGAGNDTAYGQQGKTLFMEKMVTIFLLAVVARIPL
ncbi:MAG: hypothetical protein HC856_08205 [Pseudanabaena sp. RU_4_16]|nr:hypothetical protein [Pseudanabaena sp. RU_4_16]